MSSLFTAYIFHCTSRCCFFFSVFRILTGTCTELFFLKELYFKNGKYFCLSTPRNIHRLANAKQLFNKPGLLTGSSGQIFQIKLNYCRSAFFHLSAS